MLQCVGDLGPQSVEYISFGDICECGQNVWRSKCYNMIPQPQTIMAWLVKAGFWGVVLNLLLLNSNTFLKEGVIPIIVKAGAW